MKGNPLACRVPPLQHIIQLAKHRVTTPMADYCWQPDGTQWGLLLLFFSPSLTYVFLCVCMSVGVCVCVAGGELE